MVGVATLGLKVRGNLNDEGGAGAMSDKRCRSQYMSLSATHARRPRARMRLVINVYARESILERPMRRFLARYLNQWHRIAPMMMVRMARITMCAIVSQLLAIREEKREASTGGEVT